MKLLDYWPLLIGAAIAAWFGWYTASHPTYNLPTLTEKVQQLEQRVSELEGLPDGD